jgi:hypothetical protein
VMALPKRKTLRMLLLVDQSSIRVVFLAESGLM